MFRIVHLHWFKVNLQFIFKINQHSNKLSENYKSSWNGKAKQRFIRLWWQSGFWVELLMDNKLFCQAVSSVPHLSTKESFNNYFYNHFSLCRLATLLNIVPGLKVLINLTFCLIINILIIIRVVPHNVQVFSYHLHRTWQVTLFFVCMSLHDICHKHCFHTVCTRMIRLVIYIYTRALGRIKSLELFFTSDLNYTTIHFLLLRISNIYFVFLF